MSNTTESRSSVMSFQIPRFPVAPLDKIEQIAANQTPRTTRNALIEWVLSEYAAGNLVHVSTLQGREVA